MSGRSERTVRRDEAIAVVETRGMVALAAALEAMVKSAGVEVVAVDRVGGGIVFGVVAGSTAAVRLAVVVGEAAARAHSDRVLARLYVRPAAAGRDLVSHGQLPRLSD